MKMRDLITLVEASLVDNRWAYHGTNASKLGSIAEVGLQSNFRPKGPDWHRAGRQRSFHLLYFGLEGPGGWGDAHDPYKRDENVELRFPLSALGRRRWEEDEDRPERDEYYAVSSKEFAIPPKLLQIEHDGGWIPLETFMRDFYRFR